MDMVNIIDGGSTAEATFKRLERDQAMIERLLKSREAFVDAIDWSAMTRADRDRALHHMAEDLASELWSIECHMEALARCFW